MISRFECGDARQGSGELYMSVRTGSRCFVDGDAHRTRLLVKALLDCGMGPTLLGCGRCVRGGRGAGSVSPSRARLHLRCGVTRRLARVCLLLHAAYSALTHLLPESCLFLSFFLSFTALTNFYLNSAFLRCGTRYSRPRMHPHTSRPSPPGLSASKS
jgi:hypothetical protein